MSGIIYTLDENDFIISEQKMDFNTAVAKFHGHRDQRGRRYYISVEGKDVPFKRKSKKLIDLRKSDNSEESSQNPIGEQS